ncbi:hypothetical protein UVUMRFZT_CDS0007 [Staphylococcus phage LJLAME001]
MIVRISSSVHSSERYTNILHLHNYACQQNVPFPLHPSHLQLLPLVS